MGSLSPWHWLVLLVVIAVVVVVIVGFVVLIVKLVKPKPTKRYHVPGAPTTSAPGWYPDPNDSHLVRYFMGGYGLPQLSLSRFGTDETGFTGSIDWDGHVVCGLSCFPSTRSREILIAAKFELFKDRAGISDSISKQPTARSLPAARATSRRSRLRRESSRSRRTRLAPR